MPSCHCRRTRTRASHTLDAAADRISPRVPRAREKLNWEKEEKDRNGIKVLARRACPERRRRRPGAVVKWRGSRASPAGTAARSLATESTRLIAEPSQEISRPRRCLSVGFVGYCLSANGRLLLQQSAMINQAPSRRHTFTYLPRSATVVPLACRIATEYRPVSMAMSPEYSTRVVSTRRSPYPASLNFRSRCSTAFCPWAGSWCGAMKTPSGANCLATWS
jgi:hypothetical protein